MHKVDILSQPGVQEKNNTGLDHDTVLGIISQPDIQKKIIVEAGERILPRNHIPDREKDESFRARKGIGLPIALILPGNYAIQLPDDLATLYKDEVRRVRADIDLGPEDIKDERATLDAMLMQEVLKAFAKKIPNPESVSSADCELRAYSTWKEYEYMRNTPVFSDFESDDDLPQEKPAGDGAIASKDRIAAKDLKFLSDNDWRELTSIAVASKQGMVKAVRPKEGLGKFVVKKIPDPEKETGEKKELSPAQLLRLKLGKNTNWDDIAEEYASCFRQMQFYQARRAAFIDLLQRYSTEEVKEMPKTVVSLASGPYSEALVQASFADHYRQAGIEPPTVVSLDMYGKMFEVGKKILENEDVDAGPAVRADMTNLPFKNGVDMVENTSLHLLENPEAVKESLSEMTRVAKTGGLLRLISKKPLSNKFYDGLEAMGWEMMTPRNGRLRMNAAMEEYIKKTNSGELAQHMKLKLQNANYVLARKGTVGNDVPAENFSLETEEVPMTDQEVMSLKIQTLWGRLKEIKEVVKTGNMQEVKNLMWEYGFNGRKNAVENRLAEESSVEAMSIHTLLRHVKHGHFASDYRYLKEQIFGNK